MIQIVYDKIIDYCGVADIPCVIVGSKADLENWCVDFNLFYGPLPETSATNSRQVPSLEGESLARANKAGWIKTSAKNNVNIGLHMCTLVVKPPIHSFSGKAFELCLAEIEKHTRGSQPENPPQNSSCCVM